MAAGPMDGVLALARQVLAAQPFSAHMGARVTAFSLEGTEIRVPLGDHTRQQHGTTHGGVICYAADNALTFAGGAVLGPDVVTAEFKINYVRPAIGSELIARAGAIHAGKSQAVCRCDVFVVAADGAESLCATALGTIRKRG